MIPNKHPLSCERGSSFGVSNDRKTSLLRDRPARRAVKRAYRIWVSDAAHHCVQLRIDLLFTMSDNLHRVIEDRRGTNSSPWTSVLVLRVLRSCRPSLHSSKAWWSQTGSNRRPPACKAGALPTELWPRLRTLRALRWWAWEDSNFRPHAYQARALTN